MALAVDGLSSQPPTGEWVVPPPGTSANPAVNGATPNYLVLFNTSGSTESYDAFAAAASGNHVIGTGMLAAGTSAVLYGSALSAVGLDPIMVRSSGPMALSEDLGPSGGVGMVSMPGLPLAAPIGV
jgi:hypothetical protein